jgi:cellulose 1,4-beta-cellobiosidase
MPGQGQATLQWDLAAGVTSYKVWRRDSECGTDVVLATITPPSSGTTVSYTDTTVADKQHYYYKVAGFFDTQVGPQAIVAVTPQLLPPAIPQLTSATIPTAGALEVDLTWTLSATATSYSISRGIAGCCGNASGVVTLATVGAGVSSYHDTTVSAGVQYSYSVTAINAAGSSFASNRLQVSVAGPAARPTATACSCPTATPTPTPTPVTATPQAPVVTGQASYGRVRLQWPASVSSDPNRATSYTIFRGSSVCGPFIQYMKGVNTTMTDASGTSVTFFVDTGLTNGTAYYYVVVGVNRLGESLDSNVVSVTPSASLVPLAPAIVASGYYTALTPPAAEVVWRTSWDADSYIVKRATSSGGPYSTIASGIPTADPNTTTSIVNDDPNVTAGVTYYYVVIGVNAAGQGASSSPVSVTP